MCTLEGWFWVVYVKYSNGGRWSFQSSCVCTSFVWTSVSVSVSNRPLAFEPVCRRPVVASHSQQDRSFQLLVRILLTVTNVSPFR